jgi:hypothetical protein
MAISEMHLTPKGLGRQLDKGIEMKQLLVDVFARLDLLLEVGPSRLVDTPRPPIDVAEEAQCACEMLESATIGVAKVAPQEDGLALQDFNLGQEKGHAL